MLKVYFPASFYQGKNSYFSRDTSRFFYILRYIHELFYINITCLVIEFQIQNYPEFFFDQTLYKSLQINWQSLHVIYLTQFIMYSTHTTHIQVNYVRAYYIYKYTITSMTLLYVPNQFCNYIHYKNQCYCIFPALQ